MTRVLMEIQDEVQKYVYIIEQMIQADVEIVDVNLVRVAGTGGVHHDISQNIAVEGHIYTECLRLGKTLFIDNPRESEYCQSCLQKDECHEYATLCTPIKLGTELLGLIGLVCFKESQKKRVEKKLHAFIEFLEYIADFISSKVYEKREKQRTQQLLNIMDSAFERLQDGILVIGEDGYIVKANEAALKQLKNRSLVGKLIDIEPTGDTLIDGDEYKLSIENNTYFVIGERIQVPDVVAAYKAIFCFKRMTKVKNEIYQILSVAPKQGIEQIIGQSDVMMALKAKICKVADSQSTVLITGESGTGKELVARAIHGEGNRNSQPFIAINCGAIPDALLESELFGYVKGAFTGADPRGRIGKLELANKGIIFLDEIGDMPLYLQVKLLRVLQERKFVRIGSNQIIDLDVRVIAATNQNLEQLILEKKFREDLYYRLQVIPLSVPPLRDRKGDIKILVESLAQQYCRLWGRENIYVDNEIVSLLELYPWPGNVRELENTVEFMINMAEGDNVIKKEYIPKNIREFFINQNGLNQAGKCDEIEPLKEVEKRHILAALEKYGDDVEGKQQAARTLGIGIATLYRKLEKYKREK